MNVPDDPDIAYSEINPVVGLEQLRFNVTFVQNVVVGDGSLLAQKDAVIEPVDEDINI
jgi:hypothetical protein